MAVSTINNNSKAVKIMNFCNMLNNSTPSVVEYFKHSKRQKQKLKPIIKKKIYEKHYFKDVVYINPNADKMIEKISKVNQNTAMKIRNFIDSLTM